LPAMPWGHPDLILAAAVRHRVLTPGQAELIGRSRLEKVPLAQIATELGISHSALCHRRARAEARLTAALREGTLSDSGISWPGRGKNDHRNRIYQGAGIPTGTPRQQARAGRRTADPRPLRPEGGIAPRPARASPEPRQPWR